jgi:hypothetical protein
MVIKSSIDVENLCTCRDAREWGKICAHGVAVGLHWLKGQTVVESTGSSRPLGRGAVTSPSPRKTSALQRDPSGEPVELFLILPPNLDQAISRGKVMLVLEAKWAGGRCPLNALPKSRTWKFSASDEILIERLEAIADGETPAVMQLETKDFASLLPVLAGQSNISVGKSKVVKVSKTPFKLPLSARLLTGGENSRLGLE